MNGFSLGMAGVILAIACIFFGHAAEPADQVEQPKLETLEGKVVPLAEVLKKYNSNLEPDAAPHWRALVTDNGKIFPIIKDTGGLTFYRDDRLLNRPMRVQGRRIPGAQLLQVLQVHSLKEGRLHELYYWCEVCAIKRFALADRCECCGGPMELREIPEEE